MAGTHCLLPLDRKCSFATRVRTECSPIQRFGDWCSHTLGSELISN